jgi:hypothetical protein
MIIPLKETSNRARAVMPPRGTAEARTRRRGRHTLRPPITLACRTSVAESGDPKESSESFVSHEHDLIRLQCIVQRNAEACRGGIDRRLTGLAVHRA